MKLTETTLNSYSLIQLTIFEKKIKIHIPLKKEKIRVDLAHFS